jgi:hypothetical protein
MPKIPQFPIGGALSVFPLGGATAPFPPKAATATAPATAATMPANVEPAPTGELTLANIAALLDIKLDNKLGPLTTAVNGLTQDVAKLKLSTDQRFGEASLRITALEKMWETSSNKSAKSAGTAGVESLAEEVRELKRQIEEKKKFTPHSLQQDQRSCTAVIGGLTKLADKAKASAWLLKKLAEMQAPLPSEIYSKSDEFTGVLFMKFNRPDDRDLAVGLFKSAALQLEDEKKIWAKPDLPVEVRARHAVLFNLKKFLAEGWFDRRAIRIDLDAFTMTVGPEKAVTAEMAEDGKKIKLVWYDAWASWHELHTSEGLTDAVARANNMLAFVGKGKGKGKSSSGSDGSR